MTAKIYRKVLVDGLLEMAVVKVYRGPWLWTLERVDAIPAQDLASGEAPTRAAAFEAAERAAAELAAEFWTGGSTW